MYISHKNSEEQLRYGLRDHAYDQIIIDYETPQFKNYLYIQ